MTKYSETVLLTHLTNTDSLDVLAREGFMTEISRTVIPTELIQRIVAWALDQYFDSGRTVAPSMAALKETWGDKLEAEKIDNLDDTVETDTVQWAISDLRSNHARREADTFVNAFIKEIYATDGPRRVQIFQEFAERFDVITQSLVSRRNEMDGALGVETALGALRQRMDDGHRTYGMTLGIAEIDQHMFGTHPGEITVLAGGPGVGKSWVAGFAAMNEWDQGRRAMLVTLENDIGMSYDRLCCMATGTSYELWQRGAITPGQVEAVELLAKAMRESPHRPVFVQLDPGDRTATGIVRKALIEEADSLIIDQLHFVHVEAGSRAYKRNEQVPEIMQRLKELVNEGNTRLPVLLLAQINREGVALARKIGRVFKDHLAESSAVEQYADFLWALYQSEEMKAVRSAQFQQLKGRRTAERHYQVHWEPWFGRVFVEREVELDA